METDEGLQHVLPFQLQFNKLASQVQLLVFSCDQMGSRLDCSDSVFEVCLISDWQVKMSKWNLEKDLLAKFMEDPEAVLHHFDWQRLWTVSLVLFFRFPRGTSVIANLAHFAFDGELDL
ncbi:hypothetical protein BT93_L1106 [Corymbia citriodora subsp. variegata]|uniref:Uncharacterized protein n=1 Tax=Corymbia citriodora subsp. variegata TaxID=360336 RepID=A0A8T0CZB8_CORYI|nr:hypothetical protein BT93_L1106 [Corymbia citriodora subsp. variegata]